MSGGGEYTAVTFSAMSQAEADFASVFQSLQSTLSTLESELGGSLSTWTGEAQQAYYAAKRQWDAAAADMATVVNSLASVIGQANANYNSTEAANTNMWA